MLDSLCNRYDIWLIITIVYKRNTSHHFNMLIKSCSSDNGVISKTHVLSECVFVRIRTHRIERDRMKIISVLSCSRAPAFNKFVGVMNWNEHKMKCWVWITSWWNIAEYDPVMSIKMMRELNLHAHCHIPISW